MSKKRTSRKPSTAQKPPAEKPPSPPAQPEPSSPNKRPMLRAVKVTSEMLAAAREYKKATRISFYQLGEEAITERLQREGYLPPFTGAKAEPKPGE
jgi:hypothetical protein